MPDLTSFSTIGLKPALLSNLAAIGYTEMTLVQAQALPILLTGADVVARAKTGSGKTAAFGLGLLNRIDVASFRVQALVLCPTRELADQVAVEIRRLARAIPNMKVTILCGGVALGPQVNSLRRSPHIIVATPGRLLKHLRKETIDLAGLQTLVLDEADRMLDMGFADELDAILAAVPDDRQTLLFSATYPEAIAAMSAKVQKNPKMVDVTDDEQPAQITQYWCVASRENRCDELLKALRAWGGAINLVFCNTKIDCATVANYLKSQNVIALALHGDLDQSQRTEVLVRFANRSASVLVATDVAARGLDVKNLDAVFNYELPAQPEVYVHRIGRTGRAGGHGVAVSLVEQREQRRLADVQSLLPEGTLQQRDITGPAQRALPLAPEMTTIQVSGGRRNKLRPGDFLGALTAEGVLSADAIGSIDVFDNCSYVAARNAQAKAALQQLANRPIKGRRYRVRLRT